MNTNGADQNAFTRDRVKNRMLRRAADLWGYAETEIESFDPLVALLIEACSVEFEKISSEISKTQNRLLDRLAQLLHPEPDMAKPAYGIAQVRSVEARSTVHPQMQLVCKRAGNDRVESTGGAAVQEIFFTPIAPCPVVDGAVRYIATSSQIFKVDEGNQKMTVAQRIAPPAVLPYQPLYLGIELADAVDSLEGLSFFFDWSNDVDGMTWQQFLPFSQWQLSDQLLSVRAGLPDEAVLAPARSLLENEFSPMHKVEKQAQAVWESHFVTVQSAPKFSQVGPLRQAFPPVFAQWFADRDLRVLKEPLWWVEVRFSHVLPAEAINSVFCGLNCVPVMNRRLHRLTYRLQQHLNIIPLETERCFLAMREVRTSEGTRLSSIPLGNLLELDADSYTLQYGVSRFDDRSARQVLTNLQELVRDESTSFAALGEDFLSSVIRELNQAIARLEAKVEQKTRKRDTIPYLIIKPQKAGDTVFIDYWTADGESANRLLPGSRLTPYADAFLRKEACCLLTTTAGGQERPNDSEKINNYRRALLTRNRIVTLEDVRVACLSELGSSVQAVTVERGFRIDPGVTNGFQRCIRVRLHPSAAGNFPAPEWAQRTEQLRARLAAQSVANIPYQIDLLVA